MIEPKDWRQRSFAAQALARELGVIAKRRFLDRSSFSVKFKGRQDFLTEVDVEVERLIASRLAEAFPGDGMIGEEGAGRVAQDGHPTWVVDPIDGTANFARGAPHWCVSIACILGKSIEIGAIYAPMLDELFFARKGEGAFVDGVAMRPSGATALDESARGDRLERTRASRPLSRAGQASDRRRRDGGAGGSGALGLAWVAAGRRDGYCEHFINSWDCLAALLMISEAGGYRSDFLAGDALTKGGSVIAATPGIKDALIAAAAIEGIVL